MEISSNHAPSWVPLITATLLGVLAPRLARTRRRRTRRLFALRASIALSFALLSLPFSAQARGRSPLSPRRASSAAPPWSESSGFSPPRSLGRTGALPSADRAPSEGSRTGATHPAWPGHQKRQGEPVPRLFPRATDPRRDPDRDRAITAHPAGKGLARNRNTACAGAPYVVRSGDSLWSIAARALRSEAVGDVATYWPRIFDLNREVIGDDPGHIEPGQVLRLPACEA